MSAWLKENERSQFHLCGGIIFCHQEDFIGNEF